MRLGFIPTMIASGFITAIFGLLIALPTSRLSGLYLSLVTMGFSEIVRVLALNLTGLTGGPMGIKNIPNPILFGIKFKTTAQMYYLI